MTKASAQFALDADGGSRDFRAKGLFDARFSQASRDQSHRHRGTRRRTVANRCARAFDAIRAGGERTTQCEEAQREPASLWLSARRSRGFRRGKRYGEHGLRIGFTVLDSIRQRVEC
jgi:hypothetical protein